VDEMKTSVARVLTKCVLDDGCGKPGGSLTVENIRFGGQQYCRLRLRREGFLYDIGCIRDLLLAEQCIDKSGDVLSVVGLEL
jgi:hypothetical protein